VIWQLLADAVVVLHVAVVAFIGLGGFLVRRWPGLAAIHLPFVGWGLAIELARWTCPLTPLENRLRAMAGGTAYEGGFVERYLVPVLYPGGLGARGGIVLAGLVIALNVAAYAPLLVRHRRVAR
jgi:hypothetical protein